ncbi:MAG: hypothetical protein Q8N05_00405, partial [Bacteroidota bacterium]|nr:hypothetical protein [Bacteroidota bacterium]
MDDAKKMLADFYGKQEEAWQEYEQEKEIRDVTNIMRDNDVVFIHSIKPDFVPGDNSLLREGATWRSKLDIVLSMNPVLSTSTIKEGDTREKMWGSMGVILKGGLVQRAFAHDAATIATGQKSRAVHDAPTKPIAEEIQQALQGSAHYNEFVVAGGKVAGYYVCIDEERTVNRKDSVSADSIISATEAVNLPLYVIENGFVYEAVYIPAREDRNEIPPIKYSARLAKGKKVEIAELIVNDFDISDEAKAAKKEALFRNSPFNIKSPEIILINSYSQGGNFYMANEKVDLATLPEAEEDFTEIEELIQKYREGGWPWTGKESRVVHRVVDVTEDTYSVLIDGKKCFVLQNKLTKELNFIPLHKVNYYWGRQTIRTGFNTEDLGREL